MCTEFLELAARFAIDIETRDCHRRIAEPLLCVLAANVAIFDGDHGLSAECRKRQPAAGAFEVHHGDRALQVQPLQFFPRAASHVNQPSLQTLSRTEGGHRSGWVEGFELDRLVAHHQPGPALPGRQRVVAVGIFHGHGHGNPADQRTQVAGQAGLGVLLEVLLAVVVAVLLPKLVGMVLQPRFAVPGIVPSSKLIAGRFAQLPHSPADVPVNVSVSVGVHLAGPQEQRSRLYELAVLVLGVSEDLHHRLAESLGRRTLLERRNRRLGHDLQRFQPLSFGYGQFLLDFVIDRACREDRGDPRHGQQDEDESPGHGHHSLHQ